MFSVIMTNAFDEKNVCEGFVVCGPDCNFKFCIFLQWKEDFVAQNDSFQVEIFLLRFA